MDILPGNILLKNKIQEVYTGLKLTSDKAHSSISRNFSDVNSHYNKSSVLEDIVLNKYLSLINTAQAIGSNGFLNRGYIIESFTSEDYIDLEFPVNEALNLDVQNGDLTLPIDSTITHTISDIIFEEGSNGENGNSFDGYSNSDIKVITDKSSGSLFEYEALTNNFSTNTLHLGLTFKLKKEDVTNGIYIKTQTFEDIEYPVIESVEISLDGKAWTPALNILDINKGDHYIRFMPQKIRYFRVKFKQETYYSIDTLYGKKHRYVIALREVSAKLTTYKQSGEYVSINFASRGPINRVVFDASDIANKDIKYSISANNGAKWVDIKPKETKVLENVDMGLRGEIKIKSMRVKVEIDRNASPSTSIDTENHASNSTNKYFLKQKPVDVEAYIGKYISYGEEIQYSKQIQDVTSVDQSIIDDLGCPSDAPAHMIILHWIPYYAAINNDISLRINGMLIKSVDNGVYNYVIIPHSNPNHSRLIIFSDKIVKGMISLNYNAFLYDHRLYNSRTITLPQPIIDPNNSGIFIEAVMYSDYIDISNPVANDQVVGKEVANLFDESSNTSWRADTENPDTGEGTTWDVTWNTDSKESIKMYSITPVEIDDGDSSPLYKYNPSSWAIFGSDDNGATWNSLSKEEVSDSAWNNGQTKDFTISKSCGYNLFKMVIYKNCEGATQSATCSFSALRLYTAISDTLTNDDFKIVSRTELMLSESKYNPKYDYKISYIPAVNISDHVLEERASNEIILSNMMNIIPGSEVSFDYTYQGKNSTSTLKYYTPICKEFRLEML